MLTRRLMLAGIAASAAAPALAVPPPNPPPSPLGGVTRRDARLDALVAPEAKVELLASGYKWAEGPLWVKTGGYLLFSDVPGDTMYRWSRQAGVEVFLQPSGFAGTNPDLRESGSNGLTLDAKGALVFADTGNRALARLDLKTRKKELFLERYMGRRFNSPNDLVVARSGAIYFTDPPFGLKGLSQSPVKEMGFNGVYRLAPGGAVTVIDDSLGFPNGIALSPDESVLYVSNCDGKFPILRSYKLGADGLAASAANFHDFTAQMVPGATGWPDGMKVDEAGNLFACGPGGVSILTPQGELLGVIGAGRTIANCAFGEDGSTLFLTASDSLARIRLRTKGPLP